MPFEPPGRFAWDLWFSHDGKNQHVFYLQASKEECQHIQDNGKYKSTVGHAIIQNGIFVDIHPGCVFGPSTTSNTWDNLAIWTGCIYKDKDKYLMFYTAAGDKYDLVKTSKEDVRPQNIGLSTSSDLLNWRRHPDSISVPLIPNPEPGIFDGIGWRDPDIVKIGDTYHCLVAAKLLPNEDFDIKSEREGGAIAILSSKNLYDWSCSEPDVLLVSNHFFQIECPQLVWKVDGHTKQYFLIVSAEIDDVSDTRKNAFPEEECLTGTYVFEAEPVSINSKKFPEFNKPARMIAPGLYAGKVTDPKNPSGILYGFKIDPYSKEYLGGLMFQEFEFKKHLFS